MPPAAGKGELLAALAERADGSPLAKLILGARRSDARLVREAADAGHAAAQAAMLGLVSADRERLEWAERAAAGGDRTGQFQLAEMLYAGTVGPRDRERALALFREAAAQEHSAALLRLGLFGFGEDQPGRYELWGRAAARGEGTAVAQLGRSAWAQLMWWRRGDSPRAIMAIGRACRLHTDASEPRLFGLQVVPREIEAVRTCVQLGERFCGRARAAIECWVWIGRQHGVVRDIRRLIATRLWEERHLWAEKAQEP